VRRAPPALRSRSDASERARVPMAGDVLAVNTVMVARRRSPGCTCATECRTGGAGHFPVKAERVASVTWPGVSARPRGQRLTPDAGRVARVLDRRAPAGCAALLRRRGWQCRGARAGRAARFGAARYARRPAGRADAFRRSLGRPRRWSKGAAGASCTRPRPGGVAIRAQHDRRPIARRRRRHGAAAAGAPTSTGLHRERARPVLSPRVAGHDLLVGLRLDRRTSARW